ncbi:putative RNA methyltransferase [Paenibacillus sp. J22TS3]|uniref:putative RNA methyltransferase n=1 Tax=Paenibacillus sp. J22TS3 TaxID=2807192 RepID=UPI001BD119DF|nr:methyltransferase domain-containing protein [Paenibacillus sp. J22TS3]
MSHIHRRTAAANLLTACTDLLRCPVCTRPMSVVNNTNLTCANKHSYDISKYGYVNLLSRPASTKYGKPLFESRRVISEHGLFEPVDHWISQYIQGSSQSCCRPVALLDAGCGEGSHLSYIHESLTSIYEHTGIVGVGLDIAKEGVQMASKRGSSLVWLVADLARSPLSDDQFDYILNFLSPSNYAEFGRLLKEDGRIIKVVPGPDYLRELRTLLYGEPNESPHSSQDIQDRFLEHFQLVDSERLYYKRRLDRELTRHLVHMTPLSWGADAERLHDALQVDSLEITVDLDVLIGKEKE